MRYEPIYRRRLMLLCLFLLSTFESGVQAQLPAPYFFDDFEDGNATDSKPMDWQIVPWSRGTIRVDQGDLVLMPSTTVPAVPDYDASRSELDVRAGNIRLSNGSFRTRFRVENPSSYVAIGMTVRDNQVGPDDTDAGVFGTNLWAGLNSVGLNGFGAITANGTVTPTGVSQISTGIGMRIEEKDILLQFDVFGNHGELTLWTDGKAKPAPQWKGTISSRFAQDGQVNLFIQSSAVDAEDVEARFRYVAVLPSVSSPTMPGDFDDDFHLTVSDLDLLESALRSPTTNLRFDSNYDELLNDADRTAWVHALAHTWIGDADLNGQFDSEDLIRVFVAGQYDNDTAKSATWATGDWNGDQAFNNSDLILAFQDNGYAQGPRQAVASVPEPGLLAPVLVAISILAHFSYRSSSR